MAEAPEMADAAETVGEYYDDPEKAEAAETDEAAETAEAAQIADPAETAGRQWPPTWKHDVFLLPENGCFHSKLQLSFIFSCRVVKMCFLISLYNLIHPTMA